MGKKPKKTKKTSTRKISSSELKLFMKIVLMTVGVFLLVSGITVFGYVKMINDVKKPYLENLKKQAEGEGNSVADGQMAQTEMPPFVDTDLKKVKTNFLIMGIDREANLSDVILLGCFNSETKKIDLISVPRDTYSVIPKNIRSEMQRDGRKVPSSGVMKINAVHSYAGRELGAYYMKKYLESTFEINIDYYCEVDLEAFKKIVDAVGGVTMEIPGNGLHYKDPFQKLVIDVPGGMVKLDGKMAEGVVRYRATYKRGDLQRIEMQQRFLKELFNQTLDRDNIMSNLYPIITTIISYVKTDFPVTDAPKYVTYLKDLNADSVSTHVLPGNPSTVNGASYFMVDEDKTKELIDSIYGDGNLSSDVPTEMPTETPTTSQ